MKSAFLDVLSRKKGEIRSEIFRRRAEECRAQIEEYHAGHDQLQGLRGGIEKEVLDGKDLAMEWIWGHSARTSLAE
jgi:hypothetical protein